MEQPPKLRKSILEDLFLRYGAGSHFYTPLTQWRFWNRVAWTIIVLGVFAWGLGLWFLMSGP